MQQKLKLFVTLLMMLTATTAWAQFLPTYYQLSLSDNYPGGGIAMVDVPVSDPTYTLTPSVEPTRDGWFFLGWATSATGSVVYETGASITLTGNLTLYAKWDDTEAGIGSTFTVGSLNYKVTQINPREVKLTGHSGSPTDLVIPASVTFSGHAYAVTSIGYQAFQYTSMTSVTIPASVTNIDNRAFYHNTYLTSITLNSNPYIDPNAFEGTPAIITMNLTGNEGETGEYWMTFYNKKYNFQVPDGTQIFKASLSGTTLTLTELTTDKRVTKDNAVILKSTSGPISLTLTSTVSDNDFSGNSLKGVSDAAGKSGSSNDIYVLNKKTAGVGFYKLATDKTLGVGKAYLQTTSGSNFFGFEEDETTSISEELRVKSEKLNSFFDLSGRKVANPKKGIYIHNGRKEVIR